MDITPLFPQTLSGCHATADSVWRCAARIPRSPVDRWISSLWELDGACPPSRERELPRGDISVIVSLAGRHALVERDGERTFTGAWLTGLHEHAFITASGGRAFMCGARLTSEGAYRLLRAPAHEFVNRMIELDAMLGPSARAMVEAVQNAESSEMRLDVLGGYLIERMARPARWNVCVDWALAQIETSGANVAVGALARELGWSERRLHRRFLEQIGVGPRRVARIVRFHAALRALDRRRDAPLAALAHELGYYDQAHFAREFRELAGITATEYLRTRQFSLDYGFARVESSDSSKTASDAAT